MWNFSHVITHGSHMGGDANILLCSKMVIADASTFLTGFTVLFSLQFSEIATFWNFFYTCAAIFGPKVSTSVVLVLCANQAQPYMGP